MYGNDKNKTLFVRIDIKRRLLLNNYVDEYGDHYLVFVRKLDNHEYERAAKAIASSDGIVGRKLIDDSVLKIRYRGDGGQISGVEDYAAYLQSKHLSETVVLSCEGSETVQEKGADVNKANMHGWMALHRAAVHGHGSIVTLLLDNGVNINQCNSQNCTALHLAISKNKEGVKFILIDRSIYRDIKDNINNKTAIEWECGSVQEVKSSDIIFKP